MDSETVTSEAADQRKKYEELIKRKEEVEKGKRGQITHEVDKETYRYEDIMRGNKRKSSTRDTVFNNAFRIEIQEGQEKVMQIIKDPMPRPESNWFDQVLEKERKIKKEEARNAQNRLKMIDKRTRYSELIREIMSPTTKAKINPEPVFTPKSLSRREVFPDEKESKLSEKMKKVEVPVQTKRLQPRSLSRKEFSPYNARLTIMRSSSPRRTLVPLKGNLASDLIYKG